MQTRIIKPPFQKNKTAICKELLPVKSFIYFIGDSSALRKPSKEISLDVITKRQTQEKIRYVRRGRILNRVFQHEIDHMEGIINIDRVKSPDKLIFATDPSYYETANFEKVSS